jgi:hypothetical protein
LNDLNSREIIRTPPQAGKGTCSPGDEVLIRLQSSASFLDRQQTNFKIQFENTSQTNGGDFEYILSDGGNVLLDNMEVEVGEQILEKNEESARYYQHLLLATANQGHYDHEANALMKSWKYKSFANTYNAEKNDDYGDVTITDGNKWLSKDLENFKNAKQTMIVHPDSLSFFRGSRFMPLFADVLLRIKLPRAEKVMMANPRVSPSDVPAYKINSIELMASHVFPQTELLNSVHDRIFRSPSGLSMVLDGAVDVYRRDLADSQENNINIQASYSNIEGIVAMVYKKYTGADEANNDLINVCPLKNLEEFGITIQTHELGTRGGTFGLEEAYANYRRHYNMLSSIGGQGMLDYDRYKNEHTPLCVNTDLLPDAPPEVLQNSLSTNDRGSQLNISLKVSNSNDVKDARLVVFVVHKRILQLKEGIAKVGI